MKMRLLTFSIAIVLSVATIACSPKDLTRLEPTIEEQRAPLSSIRFSQQRKSEQLVSGFYEQQDYWRWTAPHFEVLLGAPPAAQTQGARLVLEFSLPRPSIAALKEVTVSAKVNHFDLSPETYSTMGQHEYRRDVPASVFVTPDTIVEFSVDKFLTPPNDGRNLALVAAAVRLEPK